MHSAFIKVQKRNTTQFEEKSNIFIVFKNTTL